MEEKNKGIGVKANDNKQARPEVKNKNNVLPMFILAGLLVIVFALMIARMANQKNAAENMPALNRSEANGLGLVQPAPAPVPDVAVPPIELPVAPLENAQPADVVSAPAIEPVKPGPVAVTPEAALPPAVAAPAEQSVEPQDAKGFFQRGEDYYYKGDFENAIKDFTKATELDLEYADAYCEMGVSYMEKADWDSAIKNFDKCIGIDPNHPKAQYAMAVSFARKPQPDVKAAREHFEKSKQLGFLYPQWFEDFLKRLEAGERFPGQEGAAKQ